MLQTGKIVSVIFNDANYEDKVELNLGDYEIIEEHGKAYAVKKKPKYPKTYEECAKVLLDRASVRNDFGYKGDLLVALQKLLVCRDAYWKIAGEEMGLGKPWEPDWGNEDETKWVIFNLQNKIKLATRDVVNAIFAFPTAEMRDAFFDNFKELIEECKELL